MGLLAFIPGVGPLLALGSSLIGIVTRCIPCMVVIGLVVAWVAGDIHGHRKSDAACHAADIAIQLKAKERDAAILADTVKFKDQQMTVLQSQSDDLKARLDEYEKSPKVACPLGVDRAGRLRNILSR